MRFFFLLLLPLALVTSCSRSTAALTIPARQTFVLGEYEYNGYRADLDNRGKQNVTAQLIEKTTGEVMESIAVPAGSRKSLTVPKSQQVHLVNATGEDAELRVIMSENVQGMRYLEDGEAYEPRPVVVKTTPLEDIDKPFTKTVTVPGGGKVAVGESFTEGYALHIVNAGKSNGLSVAGINKTTGEQTQGFGLGRMGKVDMWVRESETLHFFNEGTKEAKVVLSFSKDVKL